MAFVCGNKISWCIQTYTNTSNQLINQECKILCAIMTSTWITCVYWQRKMMCKTFLIPHIILPCYNMYSSSLSLMIVHVYRQGLVCKHKIIFIFAKSLIQTHKDYLSNKLFLCCLSYVHHHEMQFKIKWEEMKFYTCNFYLINNKLSCITYLPMLVWSLFSKCECLIKFPRQSSFEFLSYDFIFLWYFFECTDEAFYIIILLWQKYIRIVLQHQKIFLRENSFKSNVMQKYLFNET